MADKSEKSNWGNLISRPCHLCVSCGIFSLPHWLCWWRHTPSQQKGWKERRTIWKRKSIERRKSRKDQASRIRQKHVGVSRNAFVVVCAMNHPSRCHKNVLPAIGIPALARVVRLCSGWIDGRVPFPKFSGSRRRESVWPVWAERRGSSTAEARTIVVKKNDRPEPCSLSESCFEVLPRCR